MLRRSLRPHVLRFYDFARAADDIADNPTLDAEEKIRRLDGVEQALGGGAAGPANAEARAMAASLAETGVSPVHCRELLRAFRQDAVQSRYANWSELTAYCRLSAAPVGRYLIDLHKAGEQAYGASDALCAALQLINHLQDCGDDYRALNRVYLPLDWLSEEGAAVEDLAEERTGAALRRVMDRMLRAIEGLLVEAQALPVLLRSRRLAFEASVILQMAKGLTRRLAKKDPLSGPVVLSKFSLAVCAAKGVALGMMRR